MDKQEYDKLKSLIPQNIESTPKIMNRENPTCSKCGIDKTCFDASKGEYKWYREKLFDKSSALLCKKCFYRRNRLRGGVKPTLGMYDDINQSKLFSFILNNLEFAPPEVKTWIEKCKSMITG